jgi:hypothetical protein
VLVGQSDALDECGLLLAREIGDEKSTGCRLVNVADLATAHLKVAVAGGTFECDAFRSTDHTDQTGLVHCLGKRLQHGPGDERDFAVVFGLLLRRPTSLSLVLAISVGSSLALLLNLWEPIRQWLVNNSYVASDGAVASLPAASWEIVTLTTIVVSVVIFWLTGRLDRTSETRREIVDRFFKKLQTAIDRASLPTIDPAVRNRLATLFGGVFSIVGLLYGGVSLLAVGEFSGTVGVMAASLYVFGWMRDLCIDIP